MAEPTETQINFAKELETAVKRMRVLMNDYEIKISKTRGEVILLIRHVGSALFLALEQPLKEYDYLYMIYTLNESFIRIVFYPNKAF